MNLDKDDAGYLSAFVDTGDEIVMLSNGATHRARGSTVVGKMCFDNIVEVKVSGTASDGWAGDIYYSLDDGGSWDQMNCADCDGAVKMPLVVDRNGAADARFASCVGGKTCSVKVSNEGLCELIFRMFGIF